MDERFRMLLLKTTDCFGSVEMLGSVKEPILNERSLKAIARLEELYHVLCEYGVEKYISFDLGMLSKYNYYTGVIFKVYTYGVGDVIVKGGRYDNLLGYFGKEAPAIGFVVVIDDLLSALERQKSNIEIQDELIEITYDHDNYEDKLKEARRLRMEGRKAALIPEK